MFHHLYIKFYLGTPIERQEYTRLSKKIIPEERTTKYNLRGIEDKGWVNIKIVKGMYGLPQTGKIANDLLPKRLKAAGYHKCQFTLGL